MKRRSESIESVSKILNGGGGLSVELIEEAIKIFPRATIMSAYGGYILLFSYNSYMFGKEDSNCFFLMNTIYVQE